MRDGPWPAWHSSWGNMNFSRTVTGITEWFWVTIEGYLSYTLTKFDHFGSLSTLHPFTDLQFIPSKYRDRLRGQGQAKQLSKSKNNFLATTFF